jgi:PAS domain-containing protein
LWFIRSCAEYVKHLVQLNEKKEEAVEKAKKDLEAKRRKLEEDKNAQQDPSDPESTTSSLTVSSGSGHRKSEIPAEMQEEKKRKSSAVSTENTSTGKKARFSSHGSSKSSSASSDRAENCDQQRGHGVTSNQMAMSVSDLTDSNKGSSSEGQSSSQSSESSRHTEGGASSNQGSVSSDAAVARGVGSLSERELHSDVLIEGRKHKSPPPNKKKASDFDLDYEEIFLKSNVPQVLATTSGRIVAWNDFFLKATGLSGETAERLTIFSLVRSNRLSDLFEIVAAALRSDDSKRTDDVSAVTSGPIVDGNSEDDMNDGTQRSTNSAWNYTAITLPCTAFHPDKVDTADENKPLYITVTLMTDDDPRKRCFHCVFSDFPGTNGFLGTVTPELLSKLFTRDNIKQTISIETRCNRDVSQKRKRQRWQRASK